MKIVLPPFRKIVVYVISASLFYCSLSCTLPSYTSPAPGVLSIRFKTVSNNIPFAANNDFNLSISIVQADRSNGTILVLNSDVNAYQRSSAEVVNALDFRARDSSLIIGESYAPPGPYVSVALQVDPTPGVGGTQSTVTLDGYQTVYVDTTSEFFDDLVFPGLFSVNSNDTTHVIVTILLDSILQKGANNYYYLPENPVTHNKYFFISSIY
jgi:hypothetical protein